MADGNYTSMSRAAITATTISALTVLAAGCGGGSERVAGVDRGGNPVAVVTKGEITAFGSVIVNGVRYDTSSAEIIIDGTPGAETALSVGAVVTLRGQRTPDGDTGTAERIEFDDNVEGRIERVEAAANRFVVLGQTVVVSIDTVLETGTGAGRPEDLLAGDAVEVSGFPRADGSIDATLVRVKTAPDRLEVTGVAAQVDTAAATLRIGSLIVDYATAMVDGFPDGAPANGDRIEARGTQLGQNGELLAESLAFRVSGLGGAVEGASASIQGIVTRFASAEDFDVDGQPVTTNAATNFEGGDASALAENVRLEVGGTLTTEGALVADTIEFESGSNARAAGTVASVEPESGTLVVAGVAIETDADTLFRDASVERRRPFALADIGPGDAVSVAGTADGAVLTARRVTREDGIIPEILRGVAGSVADPQFLLLGVTVATDASTAFEADGQPVDASVFFAAADGRTVEVLGTWDGVAFRAETARLLN